MLFLFAAPLSAQAPEPIVQIEESKVAATPEELVTKYAKQYGVSAYHMSRTIDCESGWRKDIQSGLYYKFSDPRRGIVKGDRERSFGPVMIHLPDHPEITETQAKDWDFALEWMAKEFAAGRQSQWYGYDPSKDLCTGTY